MRDGEQRREYFDGFNHLVCLAWSATEPYEWCYNQQQRRIIATSTNTPRNNKTKTQTNERTLTFAVGGQWPEGRTEQSVVPLSPCQHIPVQATPSVLVLGDFASQGRVGRIHSRL